MHCMLLHLWKNHNSIYEFSCVTSPCTKGIRYLVICNFTICKFDSYKIWGLYVVQTQKMAHLPHFSGIYSISSCHGLHSNFFFITAFCENDSKRKPNAFIAFYKINFILETYLAIWEFARVWGSALLCLRLSLREI